MAELFIYRIKDVQPVINAMTDADFERTIREADEADRIVENISSDSQALGRLAIDYPLLGMHLSNFITLFFKIFCPRREFNFNLWC